MRKFNKESRIGLNTPLEGLIALVVDANVTSRRLMVKLLRENGCSKVHETGDVRDADDLLSISFGNLDVALINADLPKISGVGLVKMLRIGKSQGHAETPCMLYHPLADDALRTIGYKLFAGVFATPVSQQELMSLILDNFDLQIPPGSQTDFAAVPTRWVPKSALANGNAADAVFVSIPSTQPEEAPPPPAASPGMDPAGMPEMRLADAVHADCVLVRPLLSRNGALLATAGETVTVQDIGGWVRTGMLAPSSRLYVMPDQNPPQRR